MDIEKIIEVVKLVRHWIDNKDIIEVNINGRIDLLHINEMRQAFIDLKNKDDTYMILDASLVSITDDSLLVRNANNHKITFADIEKAWPISDDDYNKHVDKSLNQLNINMKL